MRTRATVHSNARRAPRSRPPDSLGRSLSDARGASLAEYLVVAGLIGIVAIGGFRVFGSAVLGKSSGQSKNVLCIPSDVGGAAGAGCDGAGGGGGGGGPGGGGPPGGGGGGGPPGSGAPPSGGGGPVVVAGPSGGCTGLSCTNGGAGGDFLPQCFVAGTLVATPSGSRPIESIRAGDEVVSRDASSGLFATERVVRTIETPSAPIVELALARVDGETETVRATPFHPFFTLDRGWVEAERLVRGEILLDAQDRAIQVVSVADLPTREEVFNLEVADTHSYFAGSLAVWVHNVNGQYVPPANQNPPAADAQAVTNQLAANGQVTIPLNDLGTDLQGVSSYLNTIRQQGLNATPPRLPVPATIQINIQVGGKTVGLTMETDTLYITDFNGAPLRQHNYTKLDNTAKGGGDNVPTFRRTSFENVINGGDKPIGKDGKYEWNADARNVVGVVAEGVRFTRMQGPDGWVQKMAGGTLIPRPIPVKLYDTWRKRSEENSGDPELAVTHQPTFTNIRNQGSCG